MFTKSSYSFIIIVTALSSLFICSCDEEYNNYVNESPEHIVSDSNTIVPETIKVVDYSLKIPNLLNEKSAEITIKFNHPAILAYYFDVNDGNCLISNYNMSDDSTTLTIQLPFYRIGNDYNLSFRMKDSKVQKEWIQKISFNSYKNRYKYEGVAQTVFYDYENNIVWLATSRPCRLYRIDLSTPSNPQSIDFPLCPNVLAMNPYNNKLYVGFNINTYDEAELYDRKIHILDPNTLKEEGNFAISFDNTYGYDAICPDASPCSMAFTDDGLGVVVRDTYSSNGTDYCYVYCYKDHKVAVMDRWEEYYAGVTTNYDKHSLIMTHQGYSSPNLDIVSKKNKNPNPHDIDGRYHSDEYWSGGNIMTRRFHRYAPICAYQSVQSLCLINYETDNYSPVYIQEGRRPFIDFDYKNDNHIIKFDCLTNHVLYIDMNDGSLKFVTPLGTDVKHISYIEGRDELFTIHNDNSGTYLTIYDMNLFRR